MTTPSTPFDSVRIRKAAAQCGLSTSDLAFRLDLAVRSVRRILDGDPDPGEVRLGALIRFAALIGLPLQSLFLPPPATTEVVQGEDSAASDTATIGPDDAATVVAALYDRRQPTLNTEIAEAFGWDLDRLQAALTLADQRLRATGLRLVREHGETMISPIHDHTDARSNLAQVRAAKRGLGIAEYTVVYDIHRGVPPLQGSKTYRRLVLLGYLTNIGAIELIGGAPTLTDAARYAHPHLDADTASQQT